MRTTLGKVLSLIAPLTLLPAHLLWATAVPPTLTCPGNVQAECTGGLTPVTYDVTAVDASGNPLPVTCMPPPGTGFRVGTSNVVCSATDDQGLSGSCSFTVTVVDTTPPRVTCNTNITTDATSPS